jgi:hypothetical protein
LKIFCWWKFALTALAILGEVALPLSKLPAAAGNEGAKGLPLYVDTPRPELHVTPIYGGSMLNKI